MVNLRHLARAVLLTGLLLAPAEAAHTDAPLDPTEAPPKQVEGVDVTEHLGAAVPHGLAFKDEQGKNVTLGQYFDGKHPVILTFNYSNCPMLCSLMLNGLVQGLKQLAYTPGEDFRIVTVSIDHEETPDHALKTQHRYMAEYSRPGANFAS